MEIMIKLEQKQKYDDWGYSDLDDVYLEYEEGDRVVMVIDERLVCRLDIEDMIKALNKLKDLS